MPWAESPAAVIRLAVRVEIGAAESVLAELLELVPSGVEQVDGDGWVEYAVYGSPGELPSLGRGEVEIAGVMATVRGEEVPDDWEERWKRFHHSVLVGGRLYVRPPWEDVALRPGVSEVVIDPGRAFGTGTHATTRLCLELLLELEPDGSFADLGCGSGVLAIAASRLGYDPVVAVDADRLAIAATLDNARANGVVLARVERADLRNEPAPVARTVAANLMRPLLLRMAMLIVDPPDYLVVSGLLDGEADEVGGAFAGLREHRRLSAQGWTALLLVR